MNLNDFLDTWSSHQAGSEAAGTLEGLQRRSGVPRGYRRLLPPLTLKFYDRRILRRYREAALAGRDEATADPAEGVVMFGISNSVFLIGALISQHVFGTVSTTALVIVGAAALVTFVAMLIRFDSRKDREELLNTVRKMVDVDEDIRQGRLLGKIGSLYDEALSAAKGSEATKYGEVADTLDDDTLDRILWDVHANVSILEALKSRTLSGEETALRDKALSHLGRHLDAATAVLETVRGVLRDERKGQEAIALQERRSKLFANDKVRQLHEEVDAPERRLVE